MIILISVIVVAIVIVSVAAFGKYQMSLIPQMSSEEILQYTLKGSQNGVITVGIIRDGKASYTVYGSDGKQLENALHTYEIGSLTKTVTASLVNKAVLEGKIEIDGTVDKYLDLPVKEHYPTIRELLTHTSGYKPYYLDGPMMKNHFTKKNDFFGVGDSNITKRLENAYLGFSVDEGTAVVVLSDLSPNYRIPATVLGRKIMSELIGK